MTDSSCRVCGRPLRSKWAARRIGPVCARRTGTPTIPAPDTGPIPGQLEVPLPPMQTALTWST